MNKSAAALLTLANAFGPEVRAHINWQGLLWKDDENNLHVSLRGITAGSGATCICEICDGSVEGFEAWANELKKLFLAEAVIIHDEHRSITQTVVINVVSGSVGQVSKLPGHYEADPSCGTHPSIQGVVSWVHENQGPDNK